MKSLLALRIINLFIGFDEAVFAYSLLGSTDQCLLLCVPTKVNAKNSSVRLFCKVHDQPFVD